MAMVRVIFLHLSSTIVQGEAALPHLQDALEVLSKFETESGTAPILSLIADYAAPSSPVTDQTTEAIFSEYVSMLDKLGLKQFFEPVDRRLTLANPAAFCQPDLTVVEKAIKRLRQRVNLTGCLLITSCPAEVSAAYRKMGVKVLRFDPEGLTNADFNDWSEAPLLIACIIGPESGQNKKLALQLRLAAAYDIQLVSMDDKPESSIIHGRAKKLFPVQLTKRGGPAETIQVPLPVNVEITLDKQGNVSTVKNDEPDAETIAESAHFINTLESNKQIAHGPEPLTGSETHRTEVDAKGRKLLTRKRFTAT